VFHRRRFFHGTAPEVGENPDIVWLSPSGSPMKAEDWQAGFSRCIGVVLSGRSIDIDEHGEDIHGNTILVLFNADHSLAIDFKLPGTKEGAIWEVVFDTFTPQAEPPEAMPAGTVYHLNPCSVVLLRAWEEDVCDNGRS
jgi:glycogen operon protein